MKCQLCGIAIPEMPEDATFDELLCDPCYHDYTKEIKEGSCVLVPRTGGGVSLGVVTHIANGKARVEFSVGTTFRGEATPINQISKTAHKVVPLESLKLAE